MKEIENMPRLVTLKKKKWTRQEIRTCAQNSTPRKVWGDPCISMFFSLFDFVFFLVLFMLFVFVLFPLEYFEFSYALYIFHYEFLY